MAANLTAADIAEIRRLFGEGGSTSGNAESGYSYSAPTEVNYNGRSYTYANNAGGDNGNGNGFIGYDRDPSTINKKFDKSALNGTSYDVYDQQGQSTGQQGQFSGLTKGNAGMDFIKGAAMMLPAFGAGMFPAVNSALSFGTNSLLEGGLAAGGAGAGEMASGAFLGEAPWAATGGGALDFGAASAAAGAGGGASTLASTLGGASGLLGPAAAVLGGIAGSQGQKKSATESKQMDPRMDPYIYGNDKQKGLFQYAQGLLDKQMAPGYMQGYDDMRSVGQGLLNQPIAGNGFSRFFPGR